MRHPRWESWLYSMISQSKRITQLCVELRIPMRDYEFVVKVYNFEGESDYSK